MTTVNKQQIKDIKRPDALQVQLSSILNWILENARYGVYAIVPVVIGMGGFYGFRYFKDQKKNARLEELGKVQVVYEGEQRKASDVRQAISTKIEALEVKSTPKGDAATAEDQPEKPKDPKTAQEQEKLRKELAAVRADHSESLGKYIEFGKKYEDVPEGWLAGMMAAQIFAEEGKASDARQVLEGVLTKSGDQPFYQTQGRLFLVALLEEAGEWDKALAELDSLDKALEKSGESDLKATSLLARGRIQVLKDAKEDAKKTFAQLLEKHSGSPEAQKARAYQTLLN
jgi:predicted negative regulator of RcsB-dependent stress response